MMQLQRLEIRSDSSTQETALSEFKVNVDISQNYDERSLYECHQ